MEEFLSIVMINDVQNLILIEKRSDKSCSMILSLSLSLSLSHSHSMNSVLPSLSLFLSLKGDYQAWLKRTGSCEFPSHRATL